ncbi:MAG: 6-phosphogluconolactonase [Cryobacterium sp.]|nr:6-phosphogluconolactonase [Cryobacterium sp.]
MATPVTVFDSAEELGSRLAHEIADSIERARADGRSYVLGCPGGRTPRPVYRELAREVAQRSLPLSHVVIVMMDDYVKRGPTGTYVNVDASMHFSCRKFGREEILGALNAESPDPIPESSLWVPVASSPEKYEEQLRDIGGIDLFLLASGASDGHVAFNPPGSARNSTTRLVTLAQSTKEDNLATFPDFADVKEVPDFGVTVGIETISERSRAMVMVLTGESKHRAFEILSTAEDYNPDWPATVVATRPDSRIFVDSAAAGKLEQ